MILLYYKTNNDNLYVFHCANSSCKSDTAGQSVSFYCDLARSIQARYGYGIDYCQQCLFFKKTEKKYEADLMYKCQNPKLNEQAFIVPCQTSVNTVKFIPRTCHAFTKNLRHL